VVGDRSPFVSTKSDQGGARTTVRTSGAGVALRRRPPCRNFGGDQRSKELAQQIGERSAQIARLHSALLSDIAEFDRAEAWRGDGAVSMVAWVSGHCGVSTSTARQWVRAAGPLESLPCLAEGLASGELSIDVVAPLAEVASPETDSVLREASAHWSVRQAQELVAWHRAQQEELERVQETKGDAAGAGADVPGSASQPVAAAREFEHRTLHFNDTRHSMWVAFTKDDYAVVKSALVASVKADKLAAAARTAKIAKPSWRSSGPLESSESSESSEYVPYDKRLYDALMHFVEGGGSTSDRGSRRRARLIVHAPLEALLGSATNGVPELAGGVGPIGIEVARRLACDADVVLSVESQDGSVLDQGRARREPTPAQRMEIDRRDKGCRFPGCPYTEFTDVHHLHHWTDGGETSLYNLVTLCDRHHRAVHELGWVVQGDANEVLTFVSPHGREATSAPSPTWRPPARDASRGADRRVDRPPGDPPQRR
jgi:Domain of unknown function (DUF222)/HNH endonuclease